MHQKVANFIGVFARDQLSTKIICPSSLIVNTDKINESGEHWLGLFFDINGTCNFFDPLGFSPKYHNFDEFIKKNCVNYYYNDRRVQSLLSKNCGYFCCLFILKINQNYSFFKFLNLFFFDYNLNEKLIEKLKLSPGIITVWILMRSSVVGLKS
jgi:hypothetical protein